LIRSSGSAAILIKKEAGKVALLLPSKKEIWFDEKCRASVGVVAGGGRLEKPIIKAGKKYHMIRARGKLWPRTSAVSMNVIDHPFGSGRGKTVSHGKKGKIPKLHAPPGAKVGSLRPKRTGKKK
jgi:large subunit ribosomal protein L2